MKLSPLIVLPYLAQNSDFIYFSPSTNSVKIGTGLATIKVIMKNYPLIESSLLSFNVTILDLIVPVVRDLVYTLSS